MKKTHEHRFQERLEEYAKFYQVGALNDANDKTLLHTAIKQELLMEDLQDRMEEIVNDDNGIDAGELKKLADLLRDGIKTITDVQKALGIDRKTRMAEESDTAAEYILFLKREAKNFLDKRLVKVYCKKCKVMVGRFSPVHDHTAYTVSFACSQCGKNVTMQRNAKDIFFDVKDADWRRKHPAEIIQANEKSAGFDPEELTADIEDDVVLFDDAEEIIPTEEVVKKITPKFMSGDIKIGD